MSPGPRSDRASRVSPSRPSGAASRSGAAWRPTASFESLGRRAALLGRIRSFFDARGVLEVETPLLSSAATTDLHLASFVVTATDPADPTRYLQTSPELAMKRLLAAGSGPIYQLAKAFRQGESGRLHNPEFTLLEWYRPGFDHHALLDEIDELLAATLGAAPARRVTYGELFAEHLGVDAHGDSVERLRAAATEHGIDVASFGATDSGAELDRDTWLQLLLTHAIEPTLGRGEGVAIRPTFVLDFPASQAALAKIRPGSSGAPDVAERFEVYIGGIELANGFHELTDAVEQRRRFEKDLAARRAVGLETVPVDERFLAALRAGLPECSGVALGVDRLAMIEAGAERLDEVVAFPIERA